MATPCAPDPDLSAASPVPPSVATGPVLSIESDAGITRLTLDRPAQFNALSDALLTALQQAVDAIDASTRVLVIRANGRAFCAGHDLKEMRARPEKAYYDELFARCSRLMQSLAALPQPVIAQVQGLATAAGCQLVAACDLAIADERARFAVSGIDVGLFCSTPAVALSRNIGRKRAMQMLLTGEFIDAATALDWGLINQAVPGDELETAVATLAERIMAKSAVAVATGKRLFARQLELPVSEAYALATDAMACNMMADDAAEGIDAFVAKRAPHWTHT